MKKRLKFQCWKCNRNYSLLLDITDEPKLTLVCPYCSSGCIADLAPFRKATTTVFRGEQKPEAEEAGNFPEIISTTES